MRFNEERKYIEALDSAIVNKNIKLRVIYLLNWYSRRATNCKRCYYTCVFISIIAPAFIALINGCFTELSEGTLIIFGLNKIEIISIISTIATISAGILAVTRWQDGWFRYRYANELIKSEVSLYLVKKEKENDDNIDQVFMNRIEQIVANENNEWLHFKDKIDEQEK